MAESTATGPTPNEHLALTHERLGRVLYAWGVRAEGELVKATPVGVGGALRLKWALSAEELPGGWTVTLTNSSGYLLPVELGRAPGKGISKEGQGSVGLWARRVLGLDDKRSKSFAYLLSRKYKAQGRPAQGFIGLAVPGAPGGGSVPANPVPGSLLDRLFGQVTQDLQKI